MDINQIKNAVLTELTNVSGLYSLKIQNHLYGCFIVMEDIAQQQSVDISGTILRGNKFTFDYDKQFAEIGLRYGFAMDTKLILDSYSPSYKETWINYFKELGISKNLEQVDLVEDSINEIIQKVIPAEDAFFMGAMETGSLPHHWIDKVLSLLNMPVAPVSPQPPVEEEINKSAISKAGIEKPINVIQHHRLASTRRNRRKLEAETSQRKRLAKTRRHKH